MSELKKLLDKVTRDPEYRMLECAYVVLVNGNHVLANFMVRDLSITKEAGMRHLSWAYDRRDSYVVKSEVRFLLDTISEYCIGLKHRATFELIGLYERIECINQMFAETTNMDAELKGSLERERARLKKRLSELVPA